MVRKVFCIITALVFVLVLGGCSSSETNYKTPKYGIQKEEEFRLTSLGEADYLERADKEALPERTSMRVKFNEDVDNYGERIVDFINENYNLNWLYEPIEVISADFLNTDYYIYNVFYVPNSGIMYINENPYYDLDEEILQYIYVRELIHYIRDLNVGTSNFIYPNQDALGKYSTGTLTDLLTMKFFGTKEAEEFFLTKSCYSYSTVGMQILELAIPDLMKYYLLNDMKGLEKEYNSIAKKYVDMSKLEIDNPFMNFLYMVDANQIAYKNFLKASSRSNSEDIQKYFKYHSRYLIGVYELALFECRGLSEEDKLLAISFYEKLFERESTDEEVSNIQEASEYLRSCVL